MAERTPLSQRQSVKENEYMCHCYVRSDGLVGVCVSDEEYQTRVAHSLITKILCKMYIDIMYVDTSSNGESNAEEENKINKAAAVLTYPFNDF